MKLAQHGYIVIAVIVVVTVALSCCCVCCCWSYRARKGRREARLRTKYFNKRLAESSTNREVVDKIKLFTLKELKKATHNFSEDRVLGQGGQGVVYKGMVKNGQIVAIKKPKSFEENQWKEFINELVLLSQVNHRFIVKILGCCLESKEPLLVYELMPNGTLFQHIHNASSDSSLLTWDMRVKIASETADAIAYLHSSSTNPIYHRDIKSTNILLDENYRAKVSDFGISKVISIDQSHMTTRVQGTFGYLDPEYFHSSQFTEKSDVYSFGVILVELLTSQPPIRWASTIDEERSLAVYFITSMNNNALEEIVDPRLVRETPKEHVAVLANLAKQCLNFSGVARPSMKELAIELERLRKKCYATSSTSIKDWQSFEIENTSNSSILEIGNAYTSPAACGFTNENNHKEEVQPLYFT